MLNRRVFLSSILPILVTDGLFLVFLFFVVLPSSQRIVSDLNQRFLSSMVQSAYSLMEDYHQRVEDRELTLDEAQKRYYKRLRNMRYGPDHQDYFWVNTIEGLIIMHPFFPEFENKWTWELDPEPGTIFDSFVVKAREEVEGLVVYDWYRYDGLDAKETKYSYIKLFEPWGWIVGTGVYTSEVQHAFSRLNLIIWLFALLMIFLVNAVVLLHQRSHRKSEKDKEKMQHKLIEKNNLLELLISHIPMGISIKDKALRYLMVNKSWLEDAGFENEDEVLNHTDLDLFSEKMATELEMKDREIMREQSSITDVHNESGMHTERWIESTKIPLTDVFQKVIGIITINRDITQSKESEDRLWDMAHYDFLTGLANRYLFFDRVRKTLSLAKRRIQKLAILMTDLDKFKQINDRFGHDIGDHVLKEIALRLGNCLREEDTLCRYGGDEFIILLPMINEKGDVLKVAQKLVEAMESPFLVGDQETWAGISIGIAIFPENGIDTEGLIKAADEALYQAKKVAGSSFHA